VGTTGTAQNSNAAYVVSISFGDNRHRSQSSFPFCPFMYAAMPARASSECKKDGLLSIKMV
jgi:hypothetical protein